MAKQKVPTLFVRDATGLVREFGSFSAFTWTFTDVVSSGINYFAVKIPYSFPGADPVVSFALAGIPAFIAAVTATMLIAAVPRVGGQYVMFSRAIDPSLGHIMGGFVSWVLNIYCVAWFVYIPTYFWGHLLWLVGKVNNIDLLMTWGMTIQEELGVRLAIGLVFLVVFVLIDMAGSRAMKWAINILFFAYLIGGVAAIATFVTHPPATAKESWDTNFGAGAYDEIVNTAEANGWTAAEYAPAAINWDATLRSMSFTFWAYVGFEFLAPIGGELREPKKSAFWGSLGAVIIIIIWYMVTVWSVYYSYGTAFVSQYDFVVNEKVNGEPIVNQLTINPGLESTLPLFAASATTDRNMQLIIALFVPMGIVNAIPGVQAMASRTLFAQSFDRQLPEVLSKVGRRFRGPIVAAVVSGIAAAFWLYCYIANVLVAVLYLDFMESLLYMFFGLSAMGIALRRRDLWERGYKLSIGGVPLMLIFGILTLGLAGWWMTLTAALALAPTTIIGFSIIIMIGAALYGYYYLLNLKKGINMAELYSELPPE